MSSVFDRLPKELVYHILETAGRKEFEDYYDLCPIPATTTGMVCRFVCKLWRDLLAPDCADPLTDFAERAASMGHLEVLKWAKESGCPFDKNVPSAAALSGHLDVLKWLREIGCEWDSDTCEEAAVGGHLEVLTWLRAQECPWTDGVCSWAAYGGFLDVLTWARESGCDWTEDTISEAIRGGRLSTLTWAVDNKCDWPLFLPNAYAAGTGNHAEVLTWLVDNPDSPWGRERLCRWAAEAGLVDALKAIVEPSADSMIPICTTAAGAGRLAVLTWAKEIGQLPRDGTLSAAAAEGGHLDTLKWLKEEVGCPVDAHTCARACASGREQVVKWLREEAGCPWDGQCWYEAARIPFPLILEYLDKNDCPGRDQYELIQKKLFS